MSDFVTDRHVPLFFDLSDGFPCSLDTGRPIYQCKCEDVFKENTLLCTTCDSLPKRLHMDLDTGLLVLVDVILS